MSTLIWLDGHFVETDSPLIPYNDSGFLRGLGVFDTMLARDGAPVKAEQHFARLVHDCKTCLLHDPQIDFEWFGDTVEMLLARTGLTHDAARIRTQITAGATEDIFGTPEQPLIMMTAARAAIPETPAPVYAHIIDETPRIADCIFENSKRLDYTRSYIAKNKAIALGGNEAILTNTEGNIACATTSNLFISENGTFVTPPLSDGVLNGITRKTVIRDHGAKEESISEERLLAADAVFLTNSILGIRPVHTIGEQAFKPSLIPDGLAAE